MAISSGSSPTLSKGLNLNKVGEYHPTAEDPYGRRMTAAGISDPLTYDKLVDAADAMTHGRVSTNYTAIEIRKDEYDRMEILQQAKGLSSVEKLLEVLIEEEVKRLKVDPFKPKAEYLPF